MVKVKEVVVNVVVFEGKEAGGGTGDDVIEKRPLEKWMVRIGDGNISVTI